MEGRPSGSTAESDPVQPVQPFIRFRLSHIDTVLSKEPSPLGATASPFADDHRLRKVPTIRIYGATDKGQRVVAHVHGAFPYIYCNYIGKLDPASVNSYIYRLGRALNSALALSAPPHTRVGGKEPQAVAFITICKGTAIYGYRVGYTPFLKIYVIEGKDKSRVAKCLQSGVIMRTVFEVYEEHVGFILQFMLDANLYGCGWVELGDCLFRNPLPQHEAIDTDDYLIPSCTGPYSSRLYDTLTVPPSAIHPSSGPSKISYCPLELDASISSVLNRRVVAPRHLHADFTELLHPELITKDKLVHSVRELWDDERRRRQARGESGPDQVVDTRPREWDDRALDEPIWASEPGMREAISKRAAKDLAAFKAKVGDKMPSFEDFVDDMSTAEKVQDEWLSEIRTSWESVEAVFPETVAQDKEDDYPFGAWAVAATTRKGKTWGAVSPSKSPRSPSKGKGREEAWEEEPEVDRKAWMATQAAKADRSDTEGEEAEGMIHDQDAISSDEGSGDEGEPAQDDQPAIIADPAVEEDVEPELEDTDEERPPKRPKVESPQPDDVVMDPPAAESSPPPSSHDTYDDGQLPSPRQAPPSLPLESSPASQRSRPPASPLPSSSSTSLLPPPSRARNPFASPDKAAKVRFAVEKEDSSGSELEEDDQRWEDTLQPNSAVLSDTPTPSLDNEYRPTPTLVEPSSTHVPDHLRSFIEAELPLTHYSSSPTVIASSPSTTGVLSQPDRGFESSMEVVLNDKPPPRPSTSLGISSGSSLTAVHPNSAPRSSVSSDAIIPHPPPPSTYSLSSNAYRYPLLPPTTASLTASFDLARKSRIVYLDPFYSLPADVPTRAKEYGVRSFKLKGNTIKFMPPFEHWKGRAPVIATAGGTPHGIRSWRVAEMPPTAREAREWLKEDKARGGVDAAKERASQIKCPTQVNSGFKFVRVKGAKTDEEKQHLAVLAMEVHVNTRGMLLPDPAEDAIIAVFYCFQSDNDNIGNGRAEDRQVGVIAVGTPELRRLLGPTTYTLDIVETELDLLNTLLDKVRYTWDPEIIVGYEIQYLSWGYLLERAEVKYNWDMSVELGRVSKQHTSRFVTKPGERRSFNETSVTGRHVIPVWRILEADNKLQQYSFEHVAWHVLRRRTPRFSFETLTEWYNGGVPHHIARVFDYWRDRVEMDVEMLEEAEVISQNCESARVFGVDLKSVRTRGSQFKVESVMFRIAKPESFLLLSPSRVEVGKQNAAECQPLIMEPQSAFYKGPLVVLDFTSLYPSVMIAYNYCYSTCLGRIEGFNGTDKLGTSTLTPAEGLLHLLKDQIHVSPNGFMFVKAGVRKSLLAKMLSELLDTRVMVKEGMKGASGNKALLKLLNARQLALKFLANVTYGYTSATFSGRMPCVEIADAIVQTARETLERALQTIQSTVAWGAEVVYGDTDSLFIYLPGKSKADAFRIGREMAATITSQNPRPMQLKFEKVYLPCVLLAKKRYVGFKYEQENETEPGFDAKGIETVRRDGIPATQKMQETCLKILFRTSDLSLVKAYCQEEWRKILAGTVSPQDFTIAKEVKLGSYSTKVAPPPGAAVAVRRMLLDPRAEPQYGERVPYILFQGEAKLLQVDRAISPEQFLADPRYRIDAMHYITRSIIPPLSRIFNLVGADVASWYAQMDKSQRITPRLPAQDVSTRTIYLEEHFTTERCVVCDQPGGKGGLCEECKARPDEVALAIMSRIPIVEARRRVLHEMCANCSGTTLSEPIACDSTDCPHLYSRKKVEAQVTAALQAEVVLERLR